jgi:tetratricopeptide (TPR) repeat protein
MPVERENIMARELAEPVQKWPRPKQWQVPMFLAGLTALLLVWWLRPLWHVTEVEKLDRQLAAARKALHQSPADLKEVFDLAQAALDRAQRYPDRLGETHFLIGSAYCRLAEQSPQSEADSIWQQARSHLEEAAKQTVTAADSARLMHDLGKARFHTGAPAQQVIDCLAPTVDHAAEDRAEAYRILTEAYLRLPKPNLQAALEANKKQLDLPQIDEKLLAPARLLRGKLFLQLRQPEEARKVLARIDKTTQGIYAEARLLRAQSCQQDKLYGEAAKLWEEMLTDSDQSRQAPLERIHYSLGECYQQLSRPNEAIAAWEKAAQEGGEGAQAATFRLAESKLAKHDVAGAEAAFEKALAREKNPGDYRNGLLDVTEAQRLIQQACKTYRVLGDYERSLRMADLYRKLAPAEAAQGLIGEAADEWAKHLENESQKIKVLREAATAYEKAAGLARTSSDQAKWLWLSADRYRQAHDPHQELAMLQAFLRVEAAPDRRGEAWLAVGKIRLGLNREEEARTAFLKCIEYPPPAAYQARCYLARMHIDEGKYDEAEAELKQNLGLIRDKPDSEAHEKSLFLLADLYYTRGNFRLAAVRYQEALDQYPSNPATLTVRWRLADCYRKLAQHEFDRQGIYQNVNMSRQWMQMAKANYEKLFDDLNGLKARGLLKLDGEKILNQAEFKVAECAFDLDQFAEAARLFDALADRYRYRLDGLKALRQLTQCYWAMHQPDKAQEALRRLRATLEVLDENLFAGQPDEMSRKGWFRWLDWAEKQQH